MRVFATTLAAALLLAAPNAMANGQELLSAGDELIAELGEGDPKGAIAKYEEAAKAGADEFEVQWRMARAYFWWSDWQNDDKTKIKLGKMGMAAGDKARKAQPDRVEGHYFYAICAGEYSKGISIVKALTQGMEKKFKTAAEKAQALDPDYDNGGPGNALGRFYYELPWPKRKLEKSKKILEDTVARHPNSMRTRFYLAETLVAMKDKKAALTQLEYIQANEPMKMNLADGKRYQKMAKTLEGTLSTK